jgi:hypothetical protein
MSTFDDFWGHYNKSFLTYYSEAKSFFKKKKCFSELSAVTCKKLAWPSAPGVYVVWKNDLEKRTVIYIGMTGKFDKKGRMRSTQGLKGRANRWTPYRFDNKNNCFSYDPLYVKGESRNDPPKNGYKQKIDINNVIVSCFIYDTNKKMAPAFLESLLLQAFLMQYDRLPAANNEF